MIKTFFDGESTKENRRTQKGGLYTLHKLMSRTNDYLRALNESTWFGSSVPLDRENSRTTKPLESYNNIAFKGLAYHLRLSWQAPTDNQDSWHRFSIKDKNVIRKELCKTHNECEELFCVFDKQLVVDERFKESPEINPNNIQPSYVLWLPKRGKMKWDILSRLEDISKHLQSPCCLVIADIPCMEAAMYVAAMGQSSFGRREDWPNKFTKILLATNRWTFASAEHITNSDSKTHGFTTFDTDNTPDNFTSGWKEIAPKGKGYSLRQLIIYWLKYHESKVFWNIVTSDDRLFLPETVIWSDDNEHKPTKIIHGYLDFPATTHNKQCAQLYRLALARSIELLSDSYCFLEPVDRLAEPVINDLYSQEIYEFPTADCKLENKLAVGSVLVSGITLSTTDNNQNDVHFFVHDEVYKVTGINEDRNITSLQKVTLPKTHPSLFHWNPNVTVEKSTFPKQQRIGKTPAIAPKGWLSIEIPRVDETDKCEKSFAFHSDENSYIDWQNISPSIAKFGHWHYEGHHDLVTLNISDAVEDAFNRRNHLAKFLVQYLLYPLGIDEGKIIGFEDVPPIYNRPCILIYRSHPSSERIIETLLSALDNKQRNELIQWIFPILPLRQRWGGSTLLIPPREREKIEEALQYRKKAIIFDDAVISGRTIQDLQTTLKALKAEATEVTVIANRLRLPSESGKINYFWRLDLPTMGKQGVCPWCHSLNIAKSLANKMVADTKEHRDILSWIKTWSKANTINEWHKGLEPIQLKQRLYKNFTYRSRENDGNGSHTQKIPIYRSIGLTIHTLQIHAMTASDDYCLRKIREQKQEPEIKIEVAVSQLMLFADELDTSLSYDIIMEGLLNPMVDVESNATHGQIAVLALMHILRTSSSELLQRRIIDETKNLSGELTKLSHGRIYLAFLISEILKNISHSEDEFHSGRRLLSVKHSNRAETLRAFIREMENTAGKIHSEPLPALNNKLEEGSTISCDMLSTAETSIYKLGDILQELGHDLAASDESKSYVDYRKALESCLEYARSNIIAYNRVNTKKTDTDSLEIIKLKEAISAITSPFNEVAKCYFYTIDIENNGGKYSLKNELSKIWEDKIDWQDVKVAKEFNTNPIIEHSSDSCLTTDFRNNIIQERLLYTDPLRRILRDLVCNVAYPVKANKLIQDPWGGNCQNTEAHMWVHISYFNDCARVSLSNYVEDPASTFQVIEEGAERKTRWDLLTEFSGCIKYNTEHGCRKILTIEIYLPYASKLGNSIQLGEEHASLQNNDN